MYNPWEYAEADTLYMPLVAEVAAVPPVVATVTRAVLSMAPSSEYRPYALARASMSSVSGTPVDVTLPPRALALISPVLSTSP